jgi:hypothetical protein
MCDARTVQKSDLVLNDLVRRKYIGESYFAKYNSGHKWYYMSDQGSDEVAVLKIYDSEENSDAKCKSKLKKKMSSLAEGDTYLVVVCVHSSFKIAGNEIRESIEVRTMVFDYPEGQETS